MSSKTEICPFQVGIPDEVIADLRRRIAATCWPGQELARYWATDYEVRACFRSLR